MTARRWSGRVQAWSQKCGCSEFRMAADRKARPPFAFGGPWASSCRGVGLSPSLLCLPSLPPLCPLPGTSPPQGGRGVREARLASRPAARGAGTCSLSERKRWDHGVRVSVLSCGREERHHTCRIRKGTSPCRGCQWIPALRFAPAGMTSEKKARSGHPPPFRPSVLGLDPALRAHTTLRPSPPARRSRDRGPIRFQSSGGGNAEAASARRHGTRLPRPSGTVTVAGVANGPPVKPGVTAEEEAGTCVTAAASKQGAPSKGMRLALSPAGGRRPERMAGDGLAGNRLPRKNSPTRESCMTGSEGQPEGRGASASAREAGAHRLRPGKPPTGRVA